MIQIHPSVHQILPPEQTYPIKSLQLLSTYDPKDPILARYSNLQVLSSAAGYFIGTVYTNPEGHPEPGSRDTTYFDTLPRAQHALDYLEILAAAGKSKYPFDLTVWEMKFTFEYKYKVAYRHEP